jgi:hypothetical protein
MGISSVTSFAGIAVLAIAVLGVGFWFFAGTKAVGADTDGDGFLSYDEVKAELEQRIALRHGRWEVTAEVVDSQQRNLEPREWSKELERVYRTAESIRNIDSCASWGPLQGIIAGGNEAVLQLLDSSETTLLSLNLGRGDTLFELREDLSQGQGSLISNQRFYGTIFEEVIDLKLERSIERVEHGSSKIKTYRHAISVKGKWTGDC